MSPLQILRQRPNPKLHSRYNIYCLMLLVLYHFTQIFLFSRQIGQISRYKQQKCVCIPGMEYKRYRRREKSFSRFIYFSLSASNDKRESIFLPLQEVKASESNKRKGEKVFIYFCILFSCLDRKKFFFLLTLSYVCSRRAGFRFLNSTKVLFCIVSCIYINIQRNLG